MKRAIILCLIGLEIACSKPEKKEQDDSKDRQQIAELSDKTNSGNTINTQKQEDFATFWSHFRGAILRQDTIRIQAMTHFPFQTRGESDSDPVVEYSKEEFASILQEYLQQRESITPQEDRSQLELIEATEDARKMQQTQNWARVRDLVFERSGKEWKLVFAYLSQETREKLENRTNDR